MSKENLLLYKDVGTAVYRSARTIDGNRRVAINTESLSSWDPLGSYVGS